MKKLLAGISVVFFTIWFSGCTPDQVSQFYASRGYEIDEATARWISDEIRRLPPPVNHPKAPSGEQLRRLRQCESHGNYGAVSRSGTYRGAYQFSRATWNATARAYDARFVGVDPAQAKPIVQDRMAKRLWATVGWTQWPVCGPRAR